MGNIMDELTPKNENLPVEEAQESLPVPTNRKTLYITPETKGFNYRAVLGQILQYVKMGDVLSKIKPGTQYVVQIPTEFQQAYDAGKMFMMQNQKTGKLWPTLMKISENGRNEVVTPLPVTEQGFAQGNPVQDLSMSYHNLLMQQQMARLTALVEDTYRIVEKIEHGQMDDRIARFEAGKNGLLLALSMPEGDERNMQINSSRQTLLVAQAQIGQTLKRRVNEFEELPKYAVGRFTRELLHSGYLTGKDREVSEIQEYYDFYLKATRLVAASYAICGDLKTAEDSFRIGEQFVASIDFRKVASIKYAHRDLEYMFYETPVEFMETEKEICLEDARGYDYVALKVSGENLLEGLSDVKTASISEEDSEQ